MIVATALEAPAVVSSFDDVAVVSEAIEQRGRHFGVGEDAGPFAEGEIGGDDDRGALVEPADEVEQELTAGLGKGQIAEFVENDEVHAGEVIGNPALPAIAGLSLEPIDEIDHVIEAATRAGPDAAAGNCDRQVGLAGGGFADQQGIMLLSEESAASEIAHQGLVDRGAVELEVIEILNRAWSASSMNSGTPVRPINDPKGNLLGQRLAARSPGRSSRTLQPRQYRSAPLKTAVFACGYGRNPVL